MEYLSFPAVLIVNDLFNREIQSLFYARFLAFGNFVSSFVFLYRTERAEAVLCLMAAALWIIKIFTRAYAQREELEQALKGNQ